MIDNRKKKKRNPAQALVFDAYGTLFDVQSVTAALEDKFPSRGSALSSAWRTRQLEYTWLLSLMGRYQDFWAVTGSALTASCRAMELDLDADTRADLMDRYLHLDPFPEVRPVLESLSGIPLAILSNGAPKMLRAVVKNAGLTRAFSEIISADMAKTYKPSAKVYQLAARKLGLDRKRIGFVSSNYWDIAGAKSFGFRTYWVNRSGAPPEALGIAPDATLKSLRDLIALVQR